MIKNIHEQLFKSLSTLSNFNGHFYSLFWIKLKRSVGVKGIILFQIAKGTNI